MQASDWFVLMHLGERIRRDVRTTRREENRALEALVVALAGESPVKTMREFRGLSVDELANRTGMPVAGFLGDADKTARLYP